MTRWREVSDEKPWPEWRTPSPGTSSQADPGCTQSQRGDRSVGQAVAQYQVHYEGEGEPVDLGGVTVRLRLYRDGEPLLRVNVSIGHHDVVGLPSGVDEDDQRFLAAMASQGGRELAERVRRGQWPASTSSEAPNIHLLVGRITEQLADPAGLPDLDAEPPLVHEFED